MAGKDSNWGVHSHVIARWRKGSRSLFFPFRGSEVIATDVTIVSSGSGLFPESWVVVNDLVQVAREASRISYSCNPRCGAFIQL